jgi:hypothetical protein
VAVSVAAAKDTASGVEPAQAVGVTSATATLQAQVVTGVVNAVAVFQYGTTTDYGHTVFGAPALLPKDGANVSAVVSGLQPGTTYHFRVVVAALGLQILAGAGTTFTTPAANPAAPGRPSDGKGNTGGGDSSPSGEDETPLPPVTAPEPPVLGKSVAVGPVAGKVRVRKPNGHGFSTLADGADVPSGSIVDATSGTVALTTALDTSGATQTARFHGATFKVVQAKHGREMIDIYLRGSIGSCPARGARVAAKQKRKSRSLWSQDRGGRFRTHGASSVATVRGTHWLTEDTCAGTLTKVTEGVVSVRGLHRHKTVTVKAGHSYLARRH